MSYSQEWSVLPLWISITYLLLYLTPHHAMLLVPRWSGLVLVEIQGRLDENWLLQELTRGPDRR